MIIRQPLFSAGEVVLFLCLFLSFLMTIYKRNTSLQGSGLASVCFRKKTQKTALLYIATTRQPPLPSFALLCHGLPA